MPIVITSPGITIPSGSDPAVDLVTYDFASGALAEVLPTDKFALPMLITGASGLIQDYCKRRFPQQDYSEFYNGRGFNQIWTRQYPVNWITRLAVGATTVLSIQNTATGTNQRATARLAVTGTAATGLTTTGLILTRVASGVSYPDTSITWAAYPTVQSVVDAVNALGNGWKATVGSGAAQGGTFALFPSADFPPNQAVQSCIGGTANFQQITQDVSSITLNNSSGMIACNNTTWDPVFALLNVNGTTALNVFPNGYQNIWIQYNAGFATIPAELQQACLIQVRDWLYQLQTNPQYQSETQGRWTYTLGEFWKLGLAPAVRAILDAGGWRSFRSY